MKTLALALLALSTAVHAQTTTVTLSQKVVALTTEISPEKIKWSEADYQMPVVKILLPELADATVLNHRNTDEGAPCLASYAAPSPEAVIQNQPATEKVDFTIILNKELYLDPETSLCHVTLIELVEGQIRGFKFVHDRRQHIGERHKDDCR